MSKVDKKKKRMKRAIRVRKKIIGTSEKPRLCVNKSLRNTSAQLIDDITGTTIATITSLSPDIKKEMANKTKTEIAAMVGNRIAEMAKEKGIGKVVFDRHGYVYHGRIKAIADGARKAGLEF